jgi:hypothetical protein
MAAGWAAIDEIQGEEEMLDFAEHLKVLSSAFGALVITFAAFVAAASPTVAVDTAQAPVAISQLAA